MGNKIKIVAAVVIVVTGMVFYKNWFEKRGSNKEDK